jgi:hypothetical protein
VHVFLNEYQVGRIKKMMSRTSWHWTCQYAWNLFSVTNLISKLSKNTACSINFGFVLYVIWFPSSRIYIQSLYLSFVFLAVVPRDSKIHSLMDHEMDTILAAIHVLIRTWQNLGLTFLIANAWNMSWTWYCHINEIYVLFHSCSLCSFLLRNFSPWQKFLKA